MESLKLIESESNSKRLMYESKDTTKGHYQIHKKGDDSKGYFFFITDQLPLIVVLYRERYHNKSQTTLGVKTSQFSTTATVMHYQSSFCFSIQVYSPSLIYVKYRTLPDISLSKSIRTVKLQANIFNADKVRQVIQTMNMTLSVTSHHYHAVSSNLFGNKT